MLPRGESVTAPATSTTLPTSGTTLPTSGTTLPTINTTLPTTRTSLPTAGTTIPSTGTSLPTTDTTLPISGTTLPATGTTLPTTGTTNPAQSTSTAGQPTPTPRSSAPPALPPSTTTAPPAPPMVQLPKESLAAVLKNTSSTLQPSLPSTSRPLSWDEKLRASLGAAEMDMSHISHRIQARDKGRRRSPRKRRPLDKPESEEEEEESEEDEEGAPELELSPDNITPEAQKILDTFANQLLEKLEENVAKNVVQVGSCEGSGQAHGKGKKKGEKDCICCKLEAVLPGRKVTPQGPSGRSTLNKTMPVLETSPVKTTCSAAAVSVVTSGGAKIRAKSKAGTKQAGGKKTTEVEADKVVEVKEVEVDHARDVEVIEVDLAAEVEEARAGTTESIKPIDVEVGEATPEAVDKIAEDKKLEIRIDSLIESFETEPELEAAAFSAPPVTPKKSDTFVFKTPHKTPSRARHIPPSPLQHLLSSPRALPLTPGRPSYQPSLTTPQKSGEEGGRSRHPSTLDTPPVLASPLKPPTTPNAAKTLGKNSPAYYTPSPAHSQGSQGSPVATPGLRFLQVTWPLPAPCLLLCSLPPAQPLVPHSCSPAAYSLLFCSLPVADSTESDSENGRPSASSQAL